MSCSIEIGVDRPLLTMVVMVVVVVGSVVVSTSGSSPQELVRA